MGQLMSIVMMQKLLGGVRGIDTSITSSFCSVPICSYLFHSAESHDLVKAMSSIRKEFHGEATGKEKVPGASWCFVAFEDVWKVLEMLESLSKSIIHYNSINL